MRLRCGRRAYEEIKEVIGRKFLLQPLAMEFFSSSGATQFLILSLHERDAVLRRLNTIVNALKPASEVKKVPTPIGLDLPLVPLRRASIDGTTHAHAHAPPHTHTHTT